MERPGLRAGHLVALAGGALLLLELWLPWFEVNLGPAERAELSRGAGQLGQPFGALADGVFSQLDGLRLNAWQAFGGEDVVLGGGAALAILAVLVSASPQTEGAGIRVDPASSARVAQALGLLLGLLVLVRLTQRSFPSELLSLGPGGWVALAGCALLLVGGTLASAGGAAPAPAAPAFPAGPIARALPAVPDDLPDWSAPAPAPAAEPARSVAPPPRRPG